MSGIVGLWNLDGAPVSRELVEGLSRALAYQRRDTGQVWVGGPVGFGKQFSGLVSQSPNSLQPLENAPGLVVLFDGRLDNREELLGLLKGGRVDAQDSDSVLVAAAFEAFGEQFANHLLGDFAVAVYDPRERQMVIARDALGVRPLSWCRAGDTFLFASEIKALLAHPRVPRRPDEEALAQNLIRGERSVASTFFEGIQNVAPGHMLTVSPRGIRVRQYWDFDGRRSLRLRTFSDCTEAFRHHFEQAVRRRLRGASRIAISVSGGLDSSAVFCTAEMLRQSNPDQFPRLVGITTTPADGSPADESQFIGEIERKYPVHVERLPLRTGFMQDWRSQLWRTEIPRLQLLWENHGGVLECAQRQGCETVMTGEWGDEVLVELAYLADLFRGLRWRTLWTHLNGFARWHTHVSLPVVLELLARETLHYNVPRPAIRAIRMIRHLLNRENRRRDQRWNRPWYTDKLRKKSDTGDLAAVFSTQRFTSAYTQSMYKTLRGWTEIQRMEWLQKAAGSLGMRMSFPFLDRDLVSFLMAIPGHFKLHNGTPKAIMRHALQNVYPDAIRERRWAASFKVQATGGMQRAYPYLLECLRDSRAVQWGYVRGDAVREVIRLKDNINSYTTTLALSDLLGLELWLRTFFEKPEGEETGKLSCEAIRSTA